MQILQYFALGARRHRVNRNQILSTEQPSPDDIVIRGVVLESLTSLVNAFVVDIKMIDIRFTSQMATLSNRFLIRTPRNKCEEL